MHDVHGLTEILATMRAWILRIVTVTIMYTVIWGYFSVSDVFYVVYDHKAKLDSMQLFKLLAIFLQVIKHNRDISRVIMQIYTKVDVCDESDDRQKVAWASGGFYFIFINWRLVNVWANQQSS